MEKLINVFVNIIKEGSAYGYKGKFGKVYKYIK